MNRLKDVFDDIVQDAPPIGNVAERAVARARRWRWISWGGSMTATGLAVAGVTAVALVIAGLPESSPPPDDDAPPVGNTRTAAVDPDPVPASRQIQLPEAAPDPLPARDVGKVELAYTLNCADASDRPDCAAWRVRTADGKHWQVSDAMRPGMLRLPAPAEGYERPVVWVQPSGLAVSPDGRKLAYFRDDGSFGIRDLRTGVFTRLFQADEDKVYWSAASVVWSPDGRRVAATYGLLEHTTLRAKLIDVASMRAVDLPAACCVLGLPDTGPVLMTDSTVRSGEPNWGELLIIEPDGDVSRRVPLSELTALTHDFVVRYQWARISPDGRSIVGLADVDQHLEVVTISATTGKITDRHRVASLSGQGPTKVLGWSSGSELLAGDLPGDTYGEMIEKDPSYSSGDLYAVDVRSGTVRKAVGFGPLKPTLLSVAADLL